MPSTRTILATLPGLAEQAARVTPRALTQLARLMDEHDGFPTRGDSVGGRSGSELTSVERAAGSLLPLDRDHAALRRAVEDAYLALHRAVTIANRYLDRIDASALRCTGGAGMPGALEAWGRPDCQNISEPDRKGGLCSRCRHARDKWQRGTVAA